MINNFLTNINNNFLFSKNDFLLVAVSGGVDSVVLSDLLYKCGYQFAIAHCNFSLRGIDSDEDEKFVIQLAPSYHAPCFTIRFNTPEYVRQKNLSVQMAARELRYNWFKELIKCHRFDYLLTAHHLNDTIETIFLNQLRGTGIKGINGIPLKQDKIVRPLLNFTKDEILNYASENQLKFREDKSNQSDYYQRNFIRLNIMPALKKIQPQIEKTVQKNIEHFSEANVFINAIIEEKKEKIFFKNKNIISININELKKEKHLCFFLQYILSQYNFNEVQIDAIANQIHQNQSGKKFYSNTHTLIIDRSDIFILNNQQANEHQEYIARNLYELNLFTKKLTFEIIQKKSINKINEENIYYLDRNKVKFPLVLRHWKYGDKFRLLGTHYDKKLSDIFVDKKVPLFLKDKCVLLCNFNKDIIWISQPGLINDQYKIDNQTNSVLKISVCE